MEGDSNENIIIAEEHQNRDSIAGDLWIEDKQQKEIMHVNDEFRRKHNKCERERNSYK